MKSLKCLVKSGVSVICPRVSGMHVNAEASKRCLFQTGTATASGEFSSRLMENLMGRETGRASTEAQIKDLLDAHFEAHENPHVTIARIWAALNAVEWEHRSVSSPPSSFN